MTTVLVVDDEPALVRALEINLRARWYDVLTAATGAAALEVAGLHPVDLVLLDLGLPDMDGVDVIHGLRAWCPARIVVLSARSDTTEKVRALDAGAVDYLAKPFSMDELLARLRAADRRGPDDPGSAAVVVTAAFSVDLVRSKVVRDGRDVHLTPTEWRLLEVLARSAGRLVLQRQLLHQVWGPAYDTETNYLRIYLARLRKKLEPEPSRPRHLLTEHGLGARLQP